MVDTRPRAAGLPDVSSWELAAETIAVRVRWLGLIVGVALVESRVEGAADTGNVVALRSLLVLGAVYASLDTWFSLRGQVLLHRAPLAIAALEAVFIGLLCHFDFGPGVESPFRFYYVLALSAAAIRYDRRTTYLSCLVQCLSYGTLVIPDPAGLIDSPWTFSLTLLLMLWVTWTSASLAELLKRTGTDLERLNAELRSQQSQLEDRISQRSRELQEAQASLLHQEKMAAFGLLAAGIAHEVGNALTSISSLVQMLRRRQSDEYTQQKLALMEGQLTRIQGTLRELVDFSRPTTRTTSRIDVNATIDEALHIAKYYKRVKLRVIETDFAPDLPPVHAVRDLLVQLFLNLTLNAIDATARGGMIRLGTRRIAGQIEARVTDDGHGIRVEDRPKIFQPYYTTKESGTGLGLFVSRKIVTDLGGTIEFDSEPGRGTTFVVRLPVRSPLCLPAEEPASPQRQREPSTPAAATS